MQKIYMFHFNSSLCSPLHYAKLPQKWSTWLSKVKFLKYTIFGGPIVFIQVSKVNTCNSCFFVFKHFYWGYVLNKISWIIINEHFNVIHFLQYPKKICQCTETLLNKTLVVHVEQVKFLGVNMAFLATLPFTFIF